jgi:hypothetical protein
MRERGLGAEEGGDKESADSEALSPLSYTCVKELGSKGRTISNKGVDGVILKHWTTFRVRDVFSKRERLHRRTITAGSKFSGK